MVKYHEILWLISNQLKTDEIVAASGVSQRRYNR